MAAACHCCELDPANCTCWVFPGFGKVRRMSVEPAAVTPPAHLLDEWRATAICGNDITSSCLYVAALATVYAGPLAPLALLLVAAVLYLFRFVYAEVGSALPLNGGAYNVLLNTTTRGRASVAAALTVLSYMATAVISAGEAMHYAARIVPSLPVVGATVVLLALFAALNLYGLAESAVVALGIFVVHMATLTLLVLVVGTSILLDPSVLAANLATPMAEWPTPPTSVAMALLFGFSAAMLGISGFESSANFIEEQEPGVFPKTLRNMWIAVAIFNPLISLLALGVLPMSDIVLHKEALLTELSVVGGAPLLGAGLADVLGTLVGIDAVVVLSGAVLTSFVGVTGLVERLTLDLCLPQVLLRRNAWRGTPHFIILGFLALCVSVTLWTAGRIEVLAGVYTLSFLSVMGLFAAGNLMLKAWRADLSRDVTAPLWMVVLALIAVFLALGGNLVLEPETAPVFFAYFAGTLIVLAAMYYRNEVLAAFLRLIARMPGDGAAGLRSGANRWLHDYACRRLLFVSRAEDAADVRQAIAYAVANEPIRHMSVLRFVQGKDLDAALVAEVQRMDRGVPSLRVDLVGVQGVADEGTVLGVARALGVEPNHVLVPSTADLDLRRMGGVRVVM